MLSTPRFETRPGVIVYRPEGRIDGASSTAFYDTVTQQETEPFKQLILNLESVGFISSAGLRAVLKLARWADEKGGSFAVVALQPSVAKIFDIAGILPPSQIHQSEEAVPSEGDASQAT